MISLIFRKSEKRIRRRNVKIFNNENEKRNVTMENIRNNNDNIKIILMWRNNVENNMK